MKTSFVNVLLKRRIYRKEEKEKIKVRLFPSGVAILELKEAKNVLNYRRLKGKLFRSFGISSKTFLNF